MQGHAQRPLQFQGLLEAPGLQGAGRVREPDEQSWERLEMGILIHAGSSAGEIVSAFLY